MINRRSLILGSLMLPSLAYAGGPIGPHEGTVEDFNVNVGDRCHFDFDKYEATSKDAFDTLARQLNWLKKYNYYGMTIEGHCDERGTRVYNLSLGERRAYFVKQYFISHGIQAERMQIVSYGKERPCIIGSNETAWRENRRVVVILYKQ